MGYDLHIIRGENWWEQKVEIPTAEWLAEVEACPDLRLDGFVEAATPEGASVRYENPSLATWLGHPSGAPVPLDFCEGEVVVKNPDDSTIDRLKVLATRLGARVQGDEGEFYE